MASSYDHVAPILPEYIDIMAENNFGSQASMQYEDEYEPHTGTMSYLQ